MRKLKKIRERICQPTIHPTPLLFPSSLQTQKSNPHSPRMEQARRQAGDREKAGHVRLMNKLPEWNEELQSLVLRFNKGRVLAPSAKNFLMCMMDEQDNREGVLQFGKTRKKRYALDFRHPISPLQAFGICLSLFNWNV